MRTTNSMQVVFDKPPIHTDLFSPYILGQYHSQDSNGGSSIAGSFHGKSEKSQHQMDDDWGYPHDLGNPRWSNSEAAPLPLDTRRSPGQMMLDTPNMVGWWPSVASFAVLLKMLKKGGFPKVGVPQNHGVSILSHGLMTGMNLKYPYFRKPPYALSDMMA